MDLPVSALSSIHLSVREQTCQFRNTPSSARFSPAARCALGSLSPPWWRRLCGSEVVGASELMPAAVCVFRAKGKFWQPPLAWYLDDVLECIMDKVFLFDSSVLRKSTQISPFATVFCHFQQRKVVELRSICFFSQG